MHYNPRSVSKAERVTRQVCEQGALGAVVLEMCDERWKALEDGQPAGSAQRWLLDNEFQAAADVAAAEGCPVVMGDQPIEQLSADVARIVRETFADLVSPFDGGWQRTAEAISGGVRRLQSSGGPPQAGVLSCSPAGKLNLPDFFDPAFLIGLPVALTRYALTWLIKSPKLFANAAAAGVALRLVLYEPPDAPVGVNPVADVAFLVIQVIICRIFLGALLMERETILAQSIREACDTSGGPGRTVVAVMGMAHCNAVQKILLSDKPSPC